VGVPFLSLKSYFCNLVLCTGVTNCVLSVFNKENDDDDDDDDDDSCRHFALSS